MSDGLVECVEKNNRAEALAADCEDPSSPSTNTQSFGGRNQQHTEKRRLIDSLAFTMSNFDPATIELSNDLGLIPFLPPRVDGFELTGAVWIGKKRESVSAMLDATTVSLFETYPQKSGILRSEVDEGPLSLSDFSRAVQNSRALRVRNGTDGGGISAHAKTNDVFSTAYNLTGGRKESLSHGDFLVTFLKENLVDFIKQNHAIGSELRSERNSVRKVLGFVSYRRTGNLKAEQSTTSEVEAGASADVGKVPAANASVSNASKGTVSSSGTAGDGKSVVGVHLLVCRLERNRKTGSLGFDFSDVRKLADDKLRDAQEWLAFGNFTWPLANTLKNVFRHDLPMSVVFPEDDRLGLGANWEERVEQAIIPAHLRGNIVADANQGSAVLTLIRDNPSSSTQENTGEEGIETMLARPNSVDADGATIVKGWKSSYKVLIKAPKGVLKRLSKQQEFAPGIKIVAMVPAFEFPSSLAVPIVYEGSDNDAPSTLLRFQDGFGYLFPVNGAKGDQVLASFHDSDWELDNEHRVVQQTDESQISELEGIGFQKVEPITFHGVVDQSTQFVMARQGLVKIQEVFRASAGAEAGGQEQSNVDLSSTTTNEQGVLPKTITRSFASSDRKGKKQKTQEKTED